MKFLLRKAAFINQPTHLASDPPEVIRHLPTQIASGASATRPILIELPDDIDLNNVSRTWDPQDAAARDALERMRVNDRKRAANPIPGFVPMGGIPSIEQDVAPRVATPDAVEAYLASLSAEARKAFVESAMKKAEPKKEADTMGAMAIASSKAGQKV